MQTEKKLIVARIWNGLLLIQAAEVLIWGEELLFGIQYLKTLQPVENPF